MSDGKEVKRWFSSHPGPTREMVEIVLASDHDRKTNEYEVLLNRKFEQLCEKDSVIAELRAEVAKAETTIARQEEAIENIRQQVRAMHFDIELASIERAEGEKEHE